MRNPSIYIKIFNILKDQQWHLKSEFCREWSEDRRRLNEMRQRGWIDYEERQTIRYGDVKYTEYRIKAVYPAFWEYAKKYGVLKEERQICFA